MALVYVLESAVGYAGDISPGELLASAEQEGKDLLNEFSQRLASKLRALKFLPIGVPGEEIIKAAREWPADPSYRESWPQRNTASSRRHSRKKSGL